LLLSFFAMIIARIKMFVFMIELVFKRIMDLLTQIIQKTFIMHSREYFI